jgi:sugar phosphate isomerase/epimerase
MQKLQEIGYSGGLTMQAARGENDIETAKEQLKYVRTLLNNL